MSDTQSSAPEVADQRIVEASGLQRRLPWLVAAVATIVALVLLAAMIFDLGGSKDPAKNSWQAVFLSSGQVYFGHLSDVDDDSLVLENIYYLQVQQALQPAPSPQAGTTDSGASQQVSLAKLGKFELHCPVDEMTINRDQMLFWETLQSNSKVVQAIDEYKASPDAQRQCYERDQSQPNVSVAPSTTAPSATTPPTSGP